MKPATARKCGTSRTERNGYATGQAPSQRRPRGIARAPRRRCAPCGRAASIRTLEAKRSGVGPSHRLEAGRPERFWCLDARSSVVTRDVEIKLIRQISQGRVTTEVASDNTPTRARAESSVTIFRHPLALFGHPLVPYWHLRHARVVVVAGRFAGPIKVPLRGDAMFVSTCERRSVTRDHAVQTAL
jgi:hypothetical protein